MIHEFQTLDLLVNSYLYHEDILQHLDIASIEVYCIYVIYILHTHSIVLY